MNVLSESRNMNNSRESMKELIEENEALEKEVKKLRAENIKLVSKSSHLKTENRLLNGRIKGLTKMHMIISIMYVVICIVMSIAFNIS